MHITNPQELIDKYVNGTASKEERILLESCVNKYLERDITLPAQEQLDKALFKNRAAVLLAISGQHASKKTLPTRVWLAAAALLIIASAGVILYRLSRPVYTAAIANDITPGGNSATLTLADGTQINLDSTKAGIQINNENIIYNDGNSVLAEKGRGPHEKGTYNVERTAYNSLSTPKGGQYQIILSDGTKVWLNAASTLKYPSQFSEDKREVFLAGEAYFEIKEDKTKPFKVLSKNQDVTVLGTSFNLSAYVDEPTVKTTLVAGKVQVRSKNLKLSTYNVSILSPSQQAVVKGDSMTVNLVDAESATAWKNGYLSFEGKSVTELMSSLSRWYDVQVSYEDHIPNIQFGGELKRNARLPTVIHFLNEAGLHVTVSGRELTVHGDQKQ